MSFGIILPHRWRRQPTSPVGIDWSHPLAQGLKRAYSFPWVGGYDAVIGRPAGLTGTGTVNVAIKSGAVNLDIAANDSWASLGPAEDWYGPFTVIWKMTMASITDPWGTVFCKFSSGTTTSQLGWGRNSNTSAYFQFSSGANDNFTSADLSGDIGVPVIGCLVANTGAAGRTISYYRNGRFVQTVSSIAPMPTGASNLYLSYPNAAYDGVISFEFFNYWGRAFNAQEIAAFADAPYSIARPITSRIYVPSAGTGNTPTLSSPTVVSITQTTAQPRVTVTFP
jgi:hypothetical protein